MSNFVSPLKLGRTIPKVFDGYRKPRHGEKKPDLFFTYERTRFGGYASFEAFGHTYYLVTLWWRVGGEWLVQRFFPAQQERFVKEFVEEEIRGN